MKYSVWKLTAESNSSWILWRKAGEAETLAEAREIGEHCGVSYWGVRDTADPDPYYSSPDNLWIYEVSQGKVVGA